MVTAAKQGFGYTLASIGVFVAVVLFVLAMFKADIAKVGFCRKPGLGKWAWLPAFGFLRSFEPNRNIPGCGFGGRKPAAGDT